ncbi:rab-GTPase-TBC domain-containing protein [Fennellomyces sp. T-0311]|nr:rab-GTPase-TBC domain-containing protein [Fennellomyces sp. T-0311]
MGSLQVPDLNVKPSTSTPLRQVMSSGSYPKSTPSLLPQSRSSRSNSAVSVYAAAAFDANNIRRQRSESFVQQRKSKHDVDMVPRAPSQICLSRHSPVRATTLPLPHDESSDEEEAEQPQQEEQQRKRESSVSSSNASSDSSGQDEEGAIIGNVMIRRAVRPSFVHPPPKEPVKPQEPKPKVNTNREYWSPPPISPDASIQGFHATDDPNAIVTSPSSPYDKKQPFFKLKKTNSNASNHSLFHFHKRFHHRSDQNLASDPNLVYPPPPVSFGDNPETDRYGFKKASQWLTLDAHHDFDDTYQPILERRLLKWQQLLEEYEPKLPERSSKVKRYIRKGVPAHLRGRVWLHYSGAEAKMASNPGVYAKFLGKAEEMGDTNEFADIIARDLHRTFPDNVQFRSTTDQQPAIIGALQRVLSAFSVYSPSIGYCQSLNYIVGMLLLFMNEEEAFWTLVAIVQNLLPAGVYDVTMEGSNIDQTVLMMLIWERMPHIWNKLAEKKSSFWDYAADGTSMPTITLVTNHWFLTLFINILPIETVLRVWDCFFYEGASVLFRVALTLFKMSENTIMSLDDSLEIFQVIQVFFLNVKDVV